MLDRKATSTAPMPSRRTAFTAAAAPADSIAARSGGTSMAALYSGCRVFVLRNGAVITVTPSTVRGSQAFPRPAAIGST